MCHCPVRSTLLIVWCCNQQGSSLLQGHLSRGWHALKSAPLAVHLPIWTSYRILFVWRRGWKTHQAVCSRHQAHSTDATHRTCVMEYLSINKMICWEKLGGWSTESVRSRDCRHISKCESSQHLVTDAFQPVPYHIKGYFHEVLTWHHRFGIGHI